MNLTHTGALGFDTYYDIPVVSMVVEDSEQLGRFLDQGKAVHIKMDVQNTSPAVQSTPRMSSATSPAQSIRSRSSSSAAISIHGIWRKAQPTTA